MFVHLRLHSEFSVVDGTLRIDEAIGAAAADAQPAMALTDLSNMFGAVKFYKEARGAGVKPVLGAEVFVQGLGGPAATLPGQPVSPTAQSLPRVLLLVQNKQGYLNLSELLARAWTRNVQRDQAVLTWE
ncbi:MAG: PHP domain-containing protein, partial [Burkholderiales bacterium]|nr:PHP domain-containing protein [Burkholderiales bacterium]